MEEHQRRMPLAVAHAFVRQKQLPVNHHAVRGRKDHLLRHHQLLGGILCRHKLRRQVLQLAALRTAAPDESEPARPRAARPHSPLRGEHREHLDPLAPGQLSSARRVLSAASSQTWPPVDVALIRAEDQVRVRSGLTATCSTSPSPGVSGVACPPLTGTE